MGQLKESEQLANRAITILIARGWPQEAVIELSDLLIRAGYHKCVEDMEATRAHRESLIEKAYH